MPSLRLSPESLAFRLLNAARAITLMRQGTALPQGLQAAFRDIPDPSARGAIQDIAYRTARHLGMADALCQRLVDRPPRPALLQGLLSCALVHLLPKNMHEAGYGGYDAFTVVDQAVEAAAADRSLAGAKGMVNAVLRRYLREADALQDTVALLPEARWNYPGWWMEALRQTYPDTWENVLLAGNRPPPLTLRVNSGHAEAQAYVNTLARSGIGARVIGPQAVRLDRPVPVEAIPGFQDGVVSVQDAAAQLAAPLLDVSDGMRVLDACAAPGGKTGHLLELADLDLTALDHDPKRLLRIDANLRRLGRPARLVCGDAANTSWWDGQLFDRVLADVPCTASGIVRRHPDIRWLRRPDDAARLAAVSRHILDNVWQMLRPDGKLLLVTCSVWPEESEQQAVSFAKRHPDADRLLAPGQLLPADDAFDDHDGLFFALFRKKASL